jgi:hypothetical protein
MTRVLKPLAYTTVVVAMLGLMLESPRAHPGRTDDIAVHARFDLRGPDTSPFPSDVFTVPDPTQRTGRRVNLPYPDCSIRISDCEDLDVINSLDGFGLQTRLSIPFDGPIDVNTVTSKTVFLIRLGSPIRRDDEGEDDEGDGDDDDDDPKAAHVIGINQVVWDVATSTLHVETDEQLLQHTRYAIVVTNGIRDARGQPIEAAPAFRRFRPAVRGEYGRALQDAVRAAKRLGLREREVVAASVYTTQSITPVMERIRDRIKEATPAPASFRLGPNGERAVFTLADVASIVRSVHTRVRPDAFTSAPVNLATLRHIPDAIGAVAYGVFSSPQYLVAGEFIPEVGTLTGTPVVQGEGAIYFTVFLPAGLQPAAGWPVAIVGHPSQGNRHFAMGEVAAMLASQGVATIGINAAGNAFGPLGTMAIRRIDGSSLTIPDPGRGFDQNGDTVIGAEEGGSAAPPRRWTIGARDGNRQTAIDLLQLVRLIEVGMDVDGNGAPDLDASRISFLGISGGAIYGAIFLALEPTVVAAVLHVPGVSAEYGRWAPNRRAVFLGAQLSERMPSLLNAPGITTIDGVIIGPPHFDENKPLRDQPPVINTVAGAIDIQQAMELREWGQQAGSPLPWARHLREAPLLGVPPKSVLLGFATGDQQAINPGTSALVRAGNLADRTVHYRHDLAYIEDPTIPKNPHLFIFFPTNPNALFRSITQGMQRAIAAFLASDGTLVPHPEPARLFEAPVAGPLPETLNYIQ